MVIQSVVSELGWFGVRTNAGVKSVFGAATADVNQSLEVQCHTAIIRAEALGVAPPLVQMFSEPYL
jgi:hypothetical protein